MNRIAGCTLALAAVLAVQSVLAADKIGKLPNGERPWPELPTADVQGSRNCCRISRRLLPSSRANR